MPAYNKTTWIDGSAPAIDATNLNKMEQGIFDALRQDGSTTMSGQLVTTAGSAATPAIAPTGDSNTGIFFPSADTIAFGEGGAEAMRINSSGQVGIGCDPTSALEVKSAQGVIKLASTTGTNSTYFKIDNTGGTLTLGIDNSTGSSQFGAGNYAGGLWHSGNYNLTFGTNNSVRMTISGGGNVGIGTTSPSEKLVVNGNISSLYGIHSTTLFNGNLNFYNAGSATKYINVSDDASTIAAISLDKIGSATKTCFLNGNVGIGTTSPDVFSRGYSGTILGISSSGQSAIELNSGTGNKAFIDIGVAGTRQGYLTGSSTEIELGSATAIPMYLITNNNIRATITSAGNVGIGTTPSTWGSGYTALSIKNAGNSISSSGASQLLLSSNAYDSGAGAWKYNENGYYANLMEIGSNGYLFYTTTSTQGAGNSITWSEGMRLNNSGYLLIGYTSSNGAYPLQVNGQIFATSSTIATSDGRYKKDVVALDGALEIVKALNPVQFSWKEHPVHKFNTEVPTIGFIAQEVAEVLKDKPYLDSIIKKSECTWETETGEFVEREVTRDVEKQVTREVEREITETIDGEEVTRTVTEEITETIIEQVTEIVTEPVKETHTEEFLGIAESNLIAILTKAVKELTAKVEALEAQLNGN